MAGSLADSRWVRHLRQIRRRVLRYFTPPALLAQPETLRRARLLIGFAFLGGFFGFGFAAFYFFIAHHYGAGIVAVCSACFLSMPFLLRQTGSADRTGNLYCAILTTGFFSLCWVEGGMNGHALAWLVTVPLCALLLTSRKAAHFWAGTAFVTALFTVGADLAGYPPQFLYPPAWHQFVCAAGYVALVMFMFLLGLIFERGRKTAQDRMQKTLGQLADANRRLTLLNTEKDEFLGIAAHDLKNPLTVVMGYSELLGSGRVVGQQVSRVAGSINREATRMRDLVSNLLNLNAIEEGRMSLKRERISPSAIIHGVVENQQSVAAKKNIRISAQLEAVPAWGDSSALTQVIENLVSNAVKFSKPGLEIQVRLRALQERAVIEVSDQGPGLSPADREKLFQRFGKLSAKPTGGESSHGLGLSIVKRLVDGMDGSIQCASEPNCGATFIVSLPRIEENTVPPINRVRDQADPTSCLFPSH